MEDKNKYVWIGEYVLDAEGNPVPERDILAWAKWLEQSDRYVAFTKFAWGTVSTVFLGLDPLHLGYEIESFAEYKPMLWETMVFGAS